MVYNFDAVSFTASQKSNALVAQLDRVLPSEGRGRGFDSRRARHFWAAPLARPALKFRASRSRTCTYCSRHSAQFRLVLAALATPRNLSFDQMSEKWLEPLAYLYVLFAVFRQNPPCISFARDARKPRLCLIARNVVRAAPTVIPESATALIRNLVESSEAPKAAGQKKARSVERAGRSQNLRRRRGFQLVALGITLPASS